QSCRGGGTMLGVATPAIAPTAPGQASPASQGSQAMGAPMPAPQAPAPSPPRAINPRLQHTAIGAPIVPAPAPFVDDEPLPEAPTKRAKGGVPVGIVAARIGRLVL